MRIRPIGSKVLLRIDEPAEAVEGGIVVPGQARSADRRAIVQALPANYRGDLREGDAVVVPKYGGGGTEVKINGDTLLVLNANELHAAYD